MYMRLKVLHSRPTFQVQHCTQVDLSFSPLTTFQTTSTSLARNSTMHLYKSHLQNWNERISSTAQQAVQPNVQNNRTKQISIIMILKFSQKFVETFYSESWRSFRKNESQTFLTKN